MRSQKNTSLKNPVTPPGIDPGTFRLVAQRHNHYATPGLDFHIQALYISLAGHVLQMFWITCRIILVYDMKIC
jgi:hypothetical protein